MSSWFVRWKKKSCQLIFYTQLTLASHEERSRAQHFTCQSTSPETREPERILLHFLKTFSGRIRPRRARISAERSKPLLFEHNVSHREATVASAVERSHSRSVCIRANVGNARSCDPIFEYLEWQRVSVMYFIYVSVILNLYEFVVRCSW